MTDHEIARTQSALRCATRAAESLALHNGPKDVRYHVATVIYDLTTLLQEAEDEYPMPGHRHHIGGYAVRNPVGEIVAIADAAGRVA